jgi:hypothetical protein
MALQSDGRILIGGGFTAVNGASRGGVARLNADGSVDTSFLASGAGPGNRLHAVIVLSSGRIFIAGEFQKYSGTSRGCVARLWN